MRAIFHDQKLEEQFHKDGYVIVPFITEEDVAPVMKIYEEFQQSIDKNSTDFDNSYKLSFFESKPEQKKQLFNDIYNYFKERIDKVLLDYKPIIVNVFTKEPEMGEVPVHQNWAFVDEKKYTSVSIWIPLIDANHQNGTMEVVPGSHKVIADVRGPSIPLVYNDMFDVLKAKYMKPIDVTLGQAVILDDSILHYTAANQTSVPRTAVQLIMTPADAKQIHYYRHPDEATNKAEMLEIQPEFFMDFNQKEKPKGGNSLGFVEYEDYLLTEDILREKIPQLADA